MFMAIIAVLFGAVFYAFKPNLSSGAREVLGVGFIVVLFAGFRLAKDKSYFQSLWRQHNSANQDSKDNEQELLNYAASLQKKTGKNDKN